MAYYPPNTSVPVPPSYYPTKSSDESRAAYMAWSDHYARWPQANPVMQAPTGVWIPAQPVHYPPHHYGYGHGRSGYGGQPVDAQGWPIKKKKKKRHDGDDDDDSDDGKSPHIGHYVPAGELPKHSDGVGIDGRVHYNWQGRTAEQVQADRHRAAIANGVYTRREQVPRAKADDQFWVKDDNGTRVRRFDDIESKMKGKWKVDERWGNSYFVKRGDKAPAGWESD